MGSEMCIRDSSQVDPLTVQVMSEVGVDISAQQSQALAEFNAEDFDVVISLCGCGVNLPEAWVTREIFQDWQLDDPAGTTLETFRRIREEVKANVETLLASI